MMYGTRYSACFLYQIQSRKVTTVKRLLRTLILLLVRIYGAPGAYRVAQQAHRQSITRPRILLIRPDHLGDLVMVTPTLQALKRQMPDAHITMMVGPWSSEVVARHPAIDCLLTCQFPGFQRSTTQPPLAPYTLLLRTARDLQGKYDLALNLRPDFWWGDALLYLAQIPYRIGYDIQPGTPFLTHALPFPSPEHATISNLRLADTGLQILGYPALEKPYTPTRYPLQFTPTAEEHNWVREHLEQAGIDAQAPVVVIHAGTGGAVKLWRTEGWATIANKLNSSATPPHIILTGSESEYPMLEKIAQSMEAPPLLLTKTTIGQLAALLQRACLVLGVDNGPLHLAITQDTPTLRIYGPTDTHIFGPWGEPEKHRVIEATQRCPTCPYIPCGRLDFMPEELPEHPCVRLVSEQVVEEAITSLLTTPSLAQKKHCDLWQQSTTEGA